jgi:hypothetical protein
MRLTLHAFVPPGKLEVQILLTVIADRASRTGAVWETGQTDRDWGRELTVGIARFGAMADSRHFGVCLARRLDCKVVNC